MEKDFAIVYNAKLIEVEDNVRQLETLGMNTNNYTLIIENIKEETQTEIKSCYEIHNKIDSNFFLHDRLANIYQKSIEKLNKISEHLLSEYDDYYKIQMEYTELSNRVKHLSESDIEKIVKETLILLKQIKKSSSIDFEEERKLVENIYELVYTVIKIELIYTNDSTVLEYIKSDISDISYIARLVKEDIKNSSQDNEELANKIKEANKVGLRDDQYLDKNLIILLGISDSDNLTKKIKKVFLDEIKDYNNLSNQLMNLKLDNENSNKQLSEIKKQNKIIAIKRLIKRVGVLLNMLCVGTAIVTSIKGAKTLTQDKEYETVTTVYDTSMPEEDITIQYFPSIENKVTLMEYSPWEEPGYFRDNYTRNVYQYDLNNVEFYEDVHDYLNPDLKQYITASKTVEVSSEKPMEDYSDNKYIITQIVQHKNEYRTIDNVGAWAVVSCIFSGCIIGFDVLLLSAFSKRFKELKHNMKKNKLKIAEKKQYLLETNNRIDELNTELIELRKTIEAKYESLPNILQEDKNVKEKKLSLDNNQN